jgi:four helix bundle protein
MYTRFEDLPVWQEAALLYCSVSDLLEESSNSFSFGFRTQLDRASLSVSNNIAEGFERMSTAELLAFLEFARGSAGEVRSMVAVIRRRIRVRPFGEQLDLIREQAESCFEADWRLDDVNRAFTPKRQTPSDVANLSAARSRDRKRQEWRSTTTWERPSSHENRGSVRMTAAVSLLSAICYLLFLYRRYCSDGQSDHPR